MTGSEDPEEWSENWDDVVDVICVGSSPGVLAYRKACGAADLDVLHIATPGELDDETRSYLASMTEDLDAMAGESEPMVTRAEPAPLRRDTRGRPDILDPFVGEQLRQWSARCAASPFAVLFTQVPDQLTRMRTDTGEIIEAAMIPEYDENDSSAEIFAGLLYEEGRLAGALVSGPSGSYRVRADSGLALPVGPGGAWPQRDGLALVSRPAGRFARLEVLLSSSDGDD